jgi:hypothetical protein
MFDARKHLQLQQGGEVISLDLAVPEDSGQETWANGLA